MPSPESTGNYFILDTLRDPSETQYETVFDNGRIVRMSVTSNNHLQVYGDVPGLTLEQFVEATNDIALDTEFKDDATITIDSDNRQSEQAGWKYPLGFRFPLRVKSLGPKPDENIAILHIASDDGVLTYQSVHAVTGKQYPSLSLRFNRAYPAYGAIIDRFTPALTGNALTRDSKFGAVILQSARFRTPTISK